MTWLIGIGAQKAGTTWLGEYFNTHPQICFSPVKELHFFDQLHIDMLYKPIKDRFLREYKLESDPQQKAAIAERIQIEGNIEGYQNYFRSMSQGEPIFSEITPSYAMLPIEGIRHMARSLKPLKIIYVLRNPVDRTWSQLKMREKLSHGKLIAYDCIQSIKQDVMVYERSNYIASLKRFKSVIPEQDFHLTFFEDLFSPCKGEETLREITSFVGVDYHRAQLSEVKNSGTADTLGQEQRAILLHQLKDVYRECLSYFGQQSLPPLWLKDIKSLGLVR